MKRKRLDTPAGRPRSRASHSAVLDAAIALVREIGYDDVTIEGIAERAGVGKATLYRWWPSKELLVVEAIERIIVNIPVPDTGSVRRDLRILLDQTGRLYRDRATAGLLSGLVAAVHRSPRIADAVRVHLVGPRQKAFAAVLARGVARGELRRGLDAALVTDMISGALFYRVLLRGQKVDARVLRGLLDTALKGALR